MTIPLMNGIWFGYAATEYKRVDDSARVGVNRILTTSAQIASLFNALYISQAALNGASISISSNAESAALAFVYLTPIVTNILCSKVNIAKNPYLKKSLLVINNHIGSMCQVAVAISSISLIYFGQPILGSVSLAFIISGFAQRRCWLPHILDRTINGVGFVGVNVARLTLGSPFYQFIALCELVNLVYLRVSHYRDKKVEHLNREKELAILLTGPSIDLTSLTLDPHHLSFKIPLPPPPQINLNILNQYFEKIDWNSNHYQKILEITVKDDLHWQENYGDQNSSAELFAYVKAGLEQFVTNIATKGITTGVVHEYRTLEAKAKHITFHLDEKSEDDQAIALLRLAIASYYCPAEYRNSIQATYLAVCDAISQESLDAIVSQVLSDARTRLFQKFLYEFIIKNPISSSIINIQDLHFYYEFVNLLGEIFNLPELEEAEKDSLSAMDIVSKKMMQYMYQPFTKPFLVEYNKTYVTDSVREAAENNQIPYPFLMDWFIDQYLVAHPMPEKNIIEKKAIAEAWCQNQVYDPMGNVIEQCLCFFLIKMGVLKYKTI